MATLNFDANEVEPAVGYEPLPAGKYQVIITDSEMKPTKSGNGHYLELTFQVIAGEHQDRLVWARLNLDNPNQTAVKIARGELSAICHSLGVMQPQDSSDLHNRPLMITVACRKREDSGEITNEVKKYEKCEVAGAPAQKSQAAPWRR